MGIVEIIVLILIVLAAIILTFFVMIQDETGEGMGGIFGGASTTPFGSRAGNVLTRITAVLAVIFFACTIGYAYLKRTPTDSSDLLGKAKEKQYEKTLAKPWFINIPTDNNAAGTTTSDEAGNLLLKSGTDQTSATTNTGATSGSTATTGKTATTSTTVKTTSAGTTSSTKTK